MKKECPSCAMEIAKSETICPVCQYEFPVETRTPWRLITLLLILIFIISVLW